MVNSPITREVAAPPGVGGQGVVGAVLPAVLPFYVVWMGKVKLVPAHLKRMGSIRWVLSYLVSGGQSEMSLRDTLVPPFFPLMLHALDATTSTCSVRRCAVKILSHTCGLCLQPMHLSGISSQLDRLKLQGLASVGGCIIVLCYAPCLWKGYCIA